MDFKTLINTRCVIGLSPMDGYTDEAMRLVQTKIAKPDVLFTEFVSAEGISRGGIKLYDTLLYSNEERPIIGQLFGKDPESFYKSAIILCHLGFDGIDINMGCPAKTVVQHGSGAALISNPDLAIELIRAVKRGVNDWYEKKVTINDLNLNTKTKKIIERNLKYSSYLANTQIKPTISVKTRLGIDISVIKLWIPKLLSENLDFITIHGRTLKQGYSGKADWKEIENVVKIAKSTGTLVWGNGDISSKQQGIEYCQKYNLNGVLIGRAALGNPWVFADLKPNLPDKFNTMIMHAHYFEKLYPNRLFDHLRKNFLLYTSGHPRARQLRQKIVRLSNIQQLYALEGDFVS